MVARTFFLGWLALAAVPAALPAQRPAAVALVGDSALNQLRYRFIGPEGNRVASLSGVPGDPDTWYAGAASGGIFKSSDGGIHWQSVFDDQPVSSIGALAVAPSDPNIVWAGTGEPWIRSHISVGWGVYKSTDAGRHWSRMGLENTGRVSRVLIHPTNPDIVYVAALGHAYGPQPERGIYRTMDGGKSWERVLFVNDSTGASDLIMDPTNPRILFAGMWQLELHTWGRESGGAGSGIYTSRDGGTTWRRLSGHGLPTRTIGKIALGIAKSNPNRVYALIETGDGAPWRGQETDRGKLWRSDDGGEQWQLVSYDRQLGGRTAYYNRMAVSPDNENEAYFLTAAFSKTLDGGRTTLDVGFGQSPGGDNHEMWIDPGNGNRMGVANDGGISISTNRGRSWNRIQLPIAQMYHVTVDNRIPYFVMGNQQDNPSARGPSNSKTGGFGGGGITRGMWHSVGGGESGWATPDPEDPDIVWSSASGSGSRGGIVVRYDLKTGMARNVEVWPQSTGGWPAAELKYRFVWTAPLTISPHDHNKLYIGSQYVHVTTNGGNSWQVISPDLTRNDKSRQQLSGGLTPDNIGVEYAGVIFAIAESRLKPGLIWAGTNDGLVQLTQDGGRSWVNLTANLPGLPTWGTISNIEPSRYDTATAYLTVDGHQVNNRDPWIYKTSDFGKTWKLIVSGIPKSPLSYAHVIREDPVRRGLLYAGTENGLYVSFNDGDSWQPLQSNLPRAPVYWLVVQEHFNDLVVATYGRGFWILDDITPLQQLAAAVTAKDAHLFAPRFAYRFRNMEAPYAVSDDPSAGQNPPYGAAIHYWLKDAPAGDSVTLRIQDAGGKLVRTLRGPARAGINRAWWDLRFEPTREARQRTSPLYAPEIVVGPQGRPLPDGGRLALLAPPGTYTVRLRAGGTELSQPLVVRKDPNSGASEEDLRAQTALLLELSADIDSVVEMTNSIESARSQLVSLRSVLAGDTAMAAVRREADSLEKKLIAVEEELVQLRLTGRGQDGVRWPIRIAGQLLYLAGQVASSDFAPTTQQREVGTLLASQARATRGRLTQLLEQDLAGFNARLRARNLPSVLYP
ncbi:MAG TPA: hypothetical protein VIP80_01090 [Gemmatimonadales bacterium]